MESYISQAFGCVVVTFPHGSNYGFVIRSDVEHHIDHVVCGPSDDQYLIFHLRVSRLGVGRRSRHMYPSNLWQMVLETSI